MMRSFWLGLALLAFSLGAGAQLPDFTQLVEKQGPAVVNVSTTSAPRAGAVPGLPNVPEDDPFYEFFRRFMPQIPGPRQFESQSLGSGFIISADGYVLTNAHVVESADEITVKLNDKREFKAKVIGTDRKTDIALLKIEASGLPAVRIGDPNRLRVGEWVVAIGSPFGFESTVTAGIVSAKGRSLPQENFVPFIQTDVAVNPGNSGGPLFNLQGEVVGVNSQIYSRTGGFMGLSFAIPIDVAMDIQQQLRTSGKVTRGRIGVGIQPVTKEMAESFGLPKAEGALVNAVEPESPAAKGGIRVSDVILQFDGKRVESADDLVRYVGNTKPGTRVPVQVWRAKSTHDLNVTVGEMSEEPATARRSRRGAPGKPAPDMATVSKLGMTLTDLREDQLKELKLAGGVLVEEATGAAARAGIRRGDVIVAVNNQGVKSVEHFSQLIGQFEQGRSVALLVRRAGGSIYVPLRIE